LGRPQASPSWRLIPNLPRLVVLAPQCIGLPAIHLPVVSRDELKLHGERPELAAHGTNQHTQGDDNVISSKQQGNSAAYLASVLKRDHPEIAEQPDPRTLEEEGAGIRSASDVPIVARQHL